MSGSTVGDAGAAGVDSTGATREPAEFWSAYQPGFRFTASEVGSPEFFAAVERHRYELEPHIREIAGFGRWRDHDVLEVGCGIATDGVNFARAGARYTGIDASPTALGLARRRFDLEGLPSRFLGADATSLPFDDGSFDLVYSHGVIHHLADAAAAVDEFRRVLRPSGVALVMVYHRSSLNYRFTILGVRRALAATLLVPGAAEAIARVTGERPEVLRGHSDLLERHGLTYLRDRQLFLDNNTDGPGNPLSKVYTREEARALFAGWRDVCTQVRYLNLRLFPGGARLAALPLARSLERRIGWHLYVRAIK